MSMVGRFILTFAVVQSNYVLAYELATHALATAHAHHSSVLNPHNPES